ncbi:MAG TPA: ThuA domain-containing protein [Microlunatus sp.]|nr:ThuA domain-containing protein [Microlunatus sp.]
MTKALFLYGGWPGHKPYEVADWATALMQDDLGFTVDATTDAFKLEDDLTGYDLIVIGWTQALTTEDLTDKQERSLLHAVSQGTGVGGWHGMAASFRSSLPYHFVTGSAFIEHPGGEAVPVPYPVNIIDRDHPVTAGVQDFTAATEQYYLHIDPTAHVLAETVFSGEHLPWLDGVKMPVAYVKTFGEGRVFYETIGHAPADLLEPNVTRLVKQGLAWAART